MTLKFLPQILDNNSFSEKEKLEKYQFHLDQVKFKVLWCHLNGDVK